MASSVMYVPHGGGPLPLLNDPGHAGLNRFLSEIPDRIGEPDSILVISAHWEEEQATVTGARQPHMLYDYYGFPDAAYRIEYPAPGDPALAGRVGDLLKDAGMASRTDPDRGYDHGTFVPLVCMYPNADIPVVQLSLLGSLDPAAHIDLGKAIAALAGENVLILGSGLSFHNMQSLRQRLAEPAPESRRFDHWLNETLVSDSTGWAEKEAALIRWSEAPDARFCHPREEHLLPLHVCFGAAQVLGLSPSNVFNEALMGAQVSGFLWQ
jgi:aromatic ring-opening dioxygenase catalytic subunit (LigB family)